MPKTLEIQNYKSLAKEFAVKKSEILEMKCLECQKTLKDLFDTNVTKNWGHKGIYLFSEKDILAQYPEYEELEVSTILVEEGEYGWEYGDDYRYYIICYPCLKDLFHHNTLDLEYQLVCDEENCEAYSKLDSCKHTTCDYDAWDDDPKAEAIYYENLHTSIDVDLIDFIYDYGIALTDSESYASWWQQY